jgi:hypothetical protein
VGRVSAPYSLAIPCAKRWAPRENLVAQPPFNTSNNVASNDQDIGDLSLIICAQGMIASSSRLQSADLQQPESLRLLVPDPQAVDL